MKTYLFLLGFGWMALLSGCKTCCKTTSTVQPPSESKFRQTEFPTREGTLPGDVTKTGKRPVLLLHELNGQSPGCLSLALDLERQGYKVYVPRFFGHYGQDTKLSFEQAGITLSPRWKLLSKNGGTALGEAQDVLDNVSARHPGQFITVIGNCMTGGFSLALLADPRVKTVVMCQPSSPFSLLGLPARTKSFGIPVKDQNAGIQALKDDPKKLLISFHRLNDKIAPIGRTRYLWEVTQSNGIGKRHQCRIGVRKDQDPHSSAGWKEIPVRHPEGHSTITALDGDEKAFRKELFQLIDR